ncbi:cytochrome P450 [Streptomyces sp. NPDC089919]|uniref:cytochrome P450 n=1 Tax=Streptomyces sp. NPDC089919 TaxID=3155188 RepID=UPI00344ADD23
MKTSNAVPRAGSGIPLLGHLWPLLRDPLGFLTGPAATGGVVEIGIGPGRLVLVRDLELTRQVLRDDRTFDKGGPLYHRIREILGSGLVNCPHGTHRRQRRLVQPAFRAASLADYAQAVTGRAAAMTTSWQHGQVVDVRTEAMTLTSEVLTTTLFSDSLPAPLRSRLLDDITTIGDGIYRRMLMPPPLDRLPTPGNRAYDRARIRLRAAIEAVIEERRAAPSGPADLLSALLAARDGEPGADGAAGPDGGGLTDGEINDTILAFFLAGTETTATTLAWALHLLAEHPAVEERLHREVDGVLAGRAATHADLAGLGLTGQVVLEALRLYPPVWFVTRTVTADTVLGGYELPRGTSVVCSPYLIHRTEEIHADQAAFDPDRWSPRPPDAPAARRRDAFLPFGGGARKCIGDTFALMEATLALATVAARWRLEHVEGTPVRPARGAVLRPQQLRMRVLARSATAATPTTRTPAVDQAPEPATGPARHIAPRARRDR